MLHSKFQNYADMLACIRVVRKEEETGQIRLILILMPILEQTFIANWNYFSVNILHLNSTLQSRSDMKWLFWFNKPESFKWHRKDYPNAETRAPTCAQTRIHSLLKRILNKLWHESYKLRCKFFNLVCWKFNSSSWEYS